MYIQVSATGEYIQETWTTVVPKPYVLEHIFRYFAAIDINNHYRQGSLEFERNWDTRTWWHRIWASIFGIIVVNVYFAYKHEHLQANHQATENLKSFDTVADELAYLLIFNPLLPGGALQPHYQASVVVALAVCSVCNSYVRAV